ncbi:hypothetical protein [Streptomyces sp. NBC_01615]|uniref:hypothetical protein n=1 Tax=Streptomyces sp. NBC_01615 TaxID=2975898 RepID=UPI003867233B
MAQTKFDKQVEETAESLAFGIGRFLAGRPIDGVMRTDATFWRSGTRVLAKVEGRVGRSSYRAGWQRLAFRIAWLAAAGEGAYLVGRHPDTSWQLAAGRWQMAQDLWENRDQALAALETGGIGAASALTVGGVTYGLLTRKRRELMREWSSRCMRRSRCRSGCRSRPTRAATSTSRRTSPTTPQRYASTCQGAWTSPRT